MSNADFHGDFSLGYFARRPFVRRTYYMGILTGFIHVVVSLEFLFYFSVVFIDGYFFRSLWFQFVSDVRMWYVLNSLWYTSMVSMTVMFFGFLLDYMSCRSSFPLLNDVLITICHFVLVTSTITAHVYSLVSRDPITPWGRAILITMIVLAVTGLVACISRLGAAYWDLRNRNAAYYDDDEDGVLSANEGYREPLLQAYHEQESINRNLSAHQLDEHAEMGQSERDQLLATEQDQLQSHGVALDPNPAPTSRFRLHMTLTGDEEFLEIPPAGVSFLLIMGVIDLICAIVDSCLPKKPNFSWDLGLRFRTSCITIAFVPFWRAYIKRQWHFEPKHHYNMSFFLVLSWFLEAVLNSVILIGGGYTTINMFGYVLLTLRIFFELTVTYISHNVLVLGKFC